MEEAKLKVLILGRHQDILNRVLAALNKLPVRIDGAITDDQAFDFLDRNQYDVISIGGGIEAETRERIRDVLITNMPDIQVIEVPRSDAESMDCLAKKPIQMDGPDELHMILSDIIEHHNKET
jgi:hypothetical protein